MIYYSKGMKFSIKTPERLNDDLVTVVFSLFEKLESGDMKGVVIPEEWEFAVH